MLLQLYLHFPFCKRKCLYCDFVSAAADEQTVAAYCHALEKEICAMGKQFAGAKVSSVFLGGGTPSIVPAPLMGSVLNTLRKNFVLLDDAEFTTEANPGTLTEPWLETLLKAGANRLSLGVQASQDELLHRIGRIHSFAEAEQSIRMVQRLGLLNINADVMYGLPGQTEADYLETLERVCALEVTHLSAYSLIVEEGTPLCRQVEAGEMNVPDDDACAAMTEAGIAFLRKHGYHQYEISNYARDGFACRHNMGYWKGAWYLGLGAAAHSMLPPDPVDAQAGAVRIRVATPENVGGYIAAAPDIQREKSLITAGEAMFETMMLGLRMNEGVSERHFEKLHGQSMVAQYGQALESLVRDGLGVWHSYSERERSFALTARGMLLQNEALLRLME